MSVSYQYNAEHDWTFGDDLRLIDLAWQGSATWLIALTLGRSEASIRTRASILGISLRPNDLPRF